MGFKFPYSAPTQTLAFKHVDINDTVEGNIHMAQQDIIQKSYAEKQNYNL